MLTLFRLAAAPLIGLVFVLLDRPLADILAFGLFVAAAVTDYLDGHLARKWEQVTAIGRVLDPIADKAMVVIALAVLMGVFGLVVWLVIPATIILFREVFVSGLREALGDRATGLKVTALAKWKTTLQMVAIGALLLGGVTTARVDLIDWAGCLLLWGAAVLTAMTGWDYAQKAAAIVEATEGRG